MQFETPEMADNARRTLSGCPLWGRNIIISSRSEFRVWGLGLGFRVGSLLGRNIVISSKQFVFQKASI